MGDVANETADALSKEIDAINEGAEVGEETDDVGTFDALDQDFVGVETQEDFTEKRDKLVAAMMKDPQVFYKCIAENYI